MTKAPSEWAQPPGVACITVPTFEDPGQLFDALSLTVGSIFADPTVYRIETVIAAPKVSARRALHRLGFRREGTLRGRQRLVGVATDEFFYALLRDDVVDGREGFTAVANAATARKRAIAHLLLTDSSSRICVLETTFKPDFELPGGILEPGESPRVGLAREVSEELQTTLPVRRLLVVDWLAPYLGWEDAIELIFDAGVIDDPRRLRPDGEEIRAVHWLEPQAASAAMAPYARGRLAAAIDARASANTCYLEAGVQIS